jgi:aspartate aminotransferase-like enzyme
MTEPGDRVLVLDNGIYGRGFADFVSMYGGCPELYSRDYRETLDVQELEAFLKEHHDYKYATVVHGDTPSGMLNDVSAICPLLKKYGIMTVVDSVSASFRCASPTGRLTSCAAVPRRSSPHLQDLLS